MAWWTKSTKRQRGSVKAHEAKRAGRRARRQQDKQEVYWGHVSQWTAAQFDEAKRLLGDKDPIEVGYPRTLDLEKDDNG